MKTAIQEVEKAIKVIEAEISNLQDQRVAPYCLKMTEEEYKKNWADWTKAVEIRNILTTTAYSIKEVINKQE